LGSIIGEPGETETQWSTKTLNDIRNNLHADYIRTRWDYQFWLNENQDWAEEDAALKNVCNDGIPIGIMLPGPDEALDATPAVTYATLGAAIGAFFARYTAAGTGRAACTFMYAELGSEENLGQSTPAEYSSYYKIVAPYIVPYKAYIYDGLVPAGPSGVKFTGSPAHLTGIAWTQQVAPNINAVPVADAPSAYGIDPYGTMVSDLAGAMTTIADAASTSQVPVSTGSGGVAVTEIGMDDCDNEPPNCTTGPQPGNHDMLDTLSDFGGVVPFVTVYEYSARTGTPASPIPVSPYDLVTATGPSHAVLYQDVQQGIAIIHQLNTTAIARKPCVAPFLKLCARKVGQ
jgi:hypothetical protein